MILGGLEIVAGGYLLHRHYRKKNQKDDFQYDTQKKRHQTYPGTNCSQQQTGWNTHVPQQQPAMPPCHTKRACYAVAPQPRPQLYTPQTIPQQQQQQQQQQYQQPRPQAPQHTQSFNIPRRPVPQHKPQIIIQPSLQRTDSFATLSRMPVANGSRPHDIPSDEDPSPQKEAKQPGLSPYGNTRYAASTPAFGATPTSPGLRYELATTEHDVDEWYGFQREYESGGEERPHYAPTVSTELGERDIPPPPYVP
ncbi:hypothetical protein yc1106_06123 [Curvularia clavata]|uniref:PAT1 multi-domain protein n=1 Tax=Curvularia clavata TaxID=95742 RepID=A0A9Q9DUJ7_CURCL|nr:hypothetical protein yc1106_06123 [Curvularia clavata]